VQFFRNVVQNIVDFVRPGPSVILPAGASLLSIPDLIPPGFKQGLEFVNEDATPMGFVVSMLRTHCGLRETEAVRLMLAIHSKGAGLLAFPSIKSVTRAATAIAEDATEHGHSMICRDVSMEESVLPVRFPG
jgi:ATP-dependent Clp protease adapter protein ClpS